MISSAPSLCVTWNNASYSTTCSSLEDTARSHRKIESISISLWFLHRSLRCLLLTSPMLCKTRAECGLFIQPWAREGSLCHGYGAHVWLWTVGSLTEIEVPLWQKVTHHVLNTLSIKYNFSSEALALTSGFELSLGKPMTSWVLTVL